MSGIIVGMMVVMTAAAGGVAALLLALPGATPLLVTLAAAYFLYLAFSIATAPPVADGTGQRPRPSFIAGVFLSLVNPKGYAAMAALFSGFALVNERPVSDATLKTAILVAIMILVDLAWLFAGAELTRFFREPHMNRAINVTFAVLLVASVGFALLF
jgi:threonine/homoserine/homoserine lactone efflux protein